MADGKKHKHREVAFSAAARLLFVRSPISALSYRAAFDAAFATRRRRRRRMPPIRSVSREDAEFRATQPQAVSAVPRAHYHHRHAARCLASFRRFFVTSGVLLFLLSRSRTLPRVSLLEHGGVTTSRTYHTISYINLLNKRTDRPLTLICMKYI